MIFGSSHQFIFFCNGRSGSTSLESALAHYGDASVCVEGRAGLYVAKHVPPWVTHLALPADVWERSYRFVFVRNPWDWVVSQWFWTFSRIPLLGRSPMPISSLNGPELRARLTPRWLMRRRRLNASDVDDLRRRLYPFRALPEAESLYQSNYVFGRDGTKLVNFVGRYESLSHDVAQLGLQISIEIPLPHLNKSDRRLYRESFTDSGRERVRELWRRDIEAFAYDF